MRRRCLLSLVAALLVIAPAASAQTDASTGDSFLFRLGTAPDTRRGLLVLTRGVQRDSATTLDLYARGLDARGRPTGTEHLVGTDATPNLLYPGAEQIGQAADTRRDRSLIAWSGHEPGMATGACPGSSGPSPFPAPPCVRRDHEIFVRLVDSAGRPSGPVRRVTSTGPPDRAEFEAVTPTVAYDRRDDSYLLVFAAATRGDLFRGELFAQRLGPDATPEGPARRLDLRPGDDSMTPLSRVVADPRGGFLLAFTWGTGNEPRELYAAALASGGRPRSVHAVSDPGGAGVGGLELAFDPGSRDALFLWSDDRRGASRGFQARRVHADGRPASRRVSLPYEVGFGPVVASSDTDGDGWLYAISQAGDRVNRKRVVVQPASRDGRPRGNLSPVTPRDGNATAPLLAPLPGGRHVLGWTDFPEGAGGKPRSFVRTL